MFNMLKKRLKNEKGLSLVELLAVIVILGIVAAIAIPAIGNIIENSRAKGEITEAIQVLNSANMYFLDNPGEPTFANDTANLADYLEVSNENTFTVSKADTPAAVTYTGKYLKGKFTLTQLNALEVEKGKITGAGTTTTPSGG